MTTEQIDFEQWLDDLVYATLEDARRHKRKVRLETLSLHVWQFSDERPSIEGAMPSDKVRQTHEYKFFLETTSAEQHRLVLESVARLDAAHVVVTEMPCTIDGRRAVTTIVESVNLLEKLARI